MPVLRPLIQPGQRDWAETARILPQCCTNQSVKQTNCQSSFGTVRKSRLITSMIIFLKRPWKEQAVPHSQKHACALRKSDIVLVLWQWVGHLLTLVICIWNRWGHSTSIATDEELLLQQWKDPIFDGDYIKSQFNSISTLEHADRLLASTPMSVALSKSTLTANSFQCKKESLM